MPQTKNTTDAVVETMEQATSIVRGKLPWVTVTRNGEDVYVPSQALITYAPDLFLDLIDLIEVVELMPDACDPATDLYIAVNVARITLDRIREGVQS
jgi:hypothetical protein